MAKTKRNPQKEVARLFDRHFDIRRLDYATRLKPIKAKAMAIGFATAGILYLVLNIAIYFAYQQGTLTDEYMGKLVMIFMIPTTIVGLLVWQIAKNRMEYPIRQDIKDFIAQAEGKSGMLWRFYPLWESFNGKVGAVKKAFGQSERVELDKIEVEDYTDAVKHLHRYLSTTDNKNIPSAAAEATVQNFNK